MEFDILESVLDNLDEITYEDRGYKPKFNYGSRADLLRFLRSKRKKATVPGSNTYPLIWLQTPVTFLQDGIHSTSDLNFVVATLSNFNLSNRERTIKTFNGVINPVINEMILKLDANSSTRIDKTKVTRRQYFNYDSDDSTAASDIWDATTLGLTIQFNLNC